MQTILVILSETAGAVYLNGRWAGEVDAEQPLSLPVAAFGAFVIEHRPFARGVLPLTARLTFSQGVPLAASFRDDPRLCAALWPGGVVELELIPERLPVSAERRFVGLSGDIRLSFEDGPAPLLRLESPAAAFVHACPAGALPPQLTVLGGNLLLRGETVSGGRYALVLSPDGATCPLRLEGRDISLLEESGSLRVLRSLEDTVGHARLETWTQEAQGWRCAQAEPMWANGAPAWPKTPEETALAALEAAQLGLMDEANGYLAPTASCAEALRRAPEFDGCVPLRYALPGGENAVGLMRLTDGLLRVTPVSYRVSPGGAPGGWRLEDLKVC